MSIWHQTCWHKGPGSSWGPDTGPQQMCRNEKELRCESDSRKKSPISSIIHLHKASSSPIVLKKIWENQAPRCSLWWSDILDDTLHELNARDQGYCPRSPAGEEHLDQKPWGDTECVHATRCLQSKQDNELLASVKCTHVEESSVLSLQRTTSSEENECIVFTSGEMLLNKQNADQQNLWFKSPVPWQKSFYVSMYKVPSHLWRWYKHTELSDIFHF